MKVAVVGCTGMVGTKVLEVLKERNFFLTELMPVASEKSMGKPIEYDGKVYPILSIQQAIELKPDIAIFSAGGNISLEWAPKFAEIGCRVIDNSSAFRMNPNHKLIIPEINADILTKEDRIIANPNCSTIQLLMVLAPLHKAFKIKRIIVSTYQSITGTGVKAVEQLALEEQGKTQMPQTYPHPIHRNALPHCDIFEENDYTKEEMKMHRETKKILDDDSVQLSATAVRVPVLGGHSESVYVAFEQVVKVAHIRKKLSQTAGVVVQDNPSKNEYPMPLSAYDKDEVFVGRIRKDLTDEKAVNMWIVGDNIRKGAATNAVQIAECLIKE